MKLRLCFSLAIVDPTMAFCLHSLQIVQVAVLKLSKCQPTSLSFSAWFPRKAELLKFTRTFLRTPRLITNKIAKGHWRNDCLQLCLVICMKMLCKNHLIKENVNRKIALSKKAVKVNLAIKCGVK